MCNFFSAIVTKSKLLWDFDLDSHEDIIAKFKINDDKPFPEFVRVELLLQDNDIFNHNLDNWKIKVDQDSVPDWFDKDKTEKQMKKKIVEIFASRFYIDNHNYNKVENQRIWAKNSTIKGFGNCTIKGFGNCTIKGFGNCTIEGSGNCTIEGYGNCTIKGFDNCTIEGFDNCTIEGSGNCTILLPNHWSKNVNIISVRDNASVKDLSDSDNPKIIVANQKIQLVQFQPTQ